MVDIHIFSSSEKLLERWNIWISGVQINGVRINEAALYVVEG
jgi:hypothetical protein